MVMVIVSVNEVEVVVVFLVLVFQGNGFFDFVVFELYGCVVGVVVGMVFCENVEGLFVMFVGY